LRFSRNAAESRALRAACFWAFPREIIGAPRPKA
jgi:hypothetical protein